MNTLLYQTNAEPVKLREARRVYLAGLMSTDYPESFQWRWEIAPLLKKHNFNVVSPLFGKPNIFNDTKDGGITSSSSSSKSILLRDRRDVREADVVLVHLETFGSPRPLVGTIAELAWAYDQQTPVVAIAAPLNTLMRTHPFIKEFVAEYVADIHEAVAFLARYYV